MYSPTYTVMNAKVNILQGTGVSTKRSQSFMMGYTVLCSPVHHLRHHRRRRWEHRYHFLGPHFHFDSTEYKVIQRNLYSFTIIFVFIIVDHKMF